MRYYYLIKNIHIILALISGMGFALRGFARLVLQEPFSHRFWRIAPHVIDTLLLATGVFLWVAAGWPFMSWLGLKLGGVVVYIAVGIAAFRARNAHGAIGLYLAALGVFLGVAALAVYKPF